MKNNYNLLLELLNRPHWGNTEIQKYFELTKSNICIKNAIRLRKAAEQKGGSVRFVTSRVTVDSILDILGKDRVEEIKLIYFLSQGNLSDE